MPESVKNLGSWRMTRPRSLGRRSTNLPVGPPLDAWDRYCSGTRVLGPQLRTLWESSARQLLVVNGPVIYEGRDNRDGLLQIGFPYRSEHVHVRVCVHVSKDRLLDY